VELLKKQTKLAAALADAGFVVFDFALPSDLAAWTVHVLPTKATTGNDCTVELFYGIKGTFYQLSGGATATATINKIYSVTKEDGIAELRVKVTCGAAKPDIGIDVILFGNRRRG
jgi:hypothetical protein